MSFEVLTRNSKHARLVVDRPLLGMLHLLVTSCLKPSIFVRTPFFFFLTYLLLYSKLLVSCSALTLIPYVASSRQLSDYLISPVIVLHLSYPIALLLQLAVLFLDCCWLTSCSYCLFLFSAIQRSIQLALILSTIFKTSNYSKNFFNNHYTIADILFQ